MDGVWSGMKDWGVGCKERTKLQSNIRIISLRVSIVQPGRINILLVINVLLRPELVIREEYSDEKRERERRRGLAVYPWHEEKLPGITPCSSESPPWSNNAINQCMKRLRERRNEYLGNDYKSWWDWSSSKRVSRSRVRVILQTRELFNYPPRFHDQQRGEKRVWGVILAQRIEKQLQEERMMGENYSLLHIYHGAYRNVVS